MIDFRACTRCGRAAPPTSAGAEGAAAQGWVQFDSEDGRVLEFVCPGCLTEGEQDAAVGMAQWRDLLADR